MVNIPKKLKKIIDSFSIKLVEVKEEGEWSWSSHSCDFSGNIFFWRSVVSHTFHLTCVAHEVGHIILFYKKPEEVKEMIYSKPFLLERMAWEKAIELFRKEEWFHLDLANKFLEKLQGEDKKKIYDVFNKFAWGIVLQMKKGE